MSPSDWRTRDCSIRLRKRDSFHARIILEGRDASPRRPPYFRIGLHNQKYHGRFGEASLPDYGDPVAAGDGAGVPKLKFTVGALSAPGCAAKNGRGAKPNIPAIKFVGKLRTAVL
jgi:hypothetical protein